MTDSLFEQYKAALRRGHVAALAGELEAALEAYRDAARLVPERALPVASQGTVLHRLDRWPEASDAYATALRMAPDDEATLRARARARDERGLQAAAADDFERLAFVLDVAGRSGEAAQAARRAADLAPSIAREALAARLAAAAANVTAVSPAGPGSALVRNDPAGPGDADVTAADADVAAIEHEIEDQGDDFESNLGGAAATPIDSGAEADADADGPVSLIVAEPHASPETTTAASRALAARIAELGTQPAWVDANPNVVPARASQADGQAWPGVDLPSPPPPPIEGPPPDPEALLAEAANLIVAGDLSTARDKMLLAAMVHRAAGRIDAALEVCLQLLTTSPGDPQVHLAIANLQLDRGWTSLATEKIELLRILTTLTGDTQAQADVHGLAAERLRDVAVSAPAAR